MNCAARQRQGRYRQCVDSGLAESDEEFKEVMSASPLCIGSGSAVSRQMNSLGEQLETDKRLRMQVEACELELTKRRKS